MVTKQVITNSYTTHLVGTNVSIPVVLVWEETRVPIYTEEIHLSELVT